MLSERIQLGILLEIAFDIVQNTRNVGEELGIAFDAIDVDESPSRFEVTLDARKVEQAPEGLSIGPHPPVRRQPIEIAVDQAVDQRLVELYLGVA
jgi:hypothetical protein